MFRTSFRFPLNRSLRSHKVPISSTVPKASRGKRAAEVTTHKYQSTGCHMASNVILPLWSPAHTQHEASSEHSQVSSYRLYLSVKNYSRSAVPDS